MNTLEKRALSYVYQKHTVYSIDFINNLFPGSPLQGTALLNELIKNDMLKKDTISNTRMFNVKLTDKGLLELMNSQTSLDPLSRNTHTTLIHILYPIIISIIISIIIPIIICTAAIRKDDALLLSLTILDNISTILEIIRFFISMGSKQNGSHH